MGCVSSKPEVNSNNDSNDLNPDPDLDLDPYPDLDPDYLTPSSLKEYKDKTIEEAFQSLERPIKKKIHFTALMQTLLGSEYLKGIALEKALKINVRNFPYLANYVKNDSEFRNSIFKKYFLENDIVKKRLDEIQNNRLTEEKKLKNIDLIRKDILELSGQEKTPEVSQKLDEQYKYYDELEPEILEKNLKKIEEQLHILQDPDLTKPEILKEILGLKEEDFDEKIKNPFDEAIIKVLDSPIEQNIDLQKIVTENDFLRYHLMEIELELNRDFQSTIKNDDLFRDNIDSLSKKFIGYLSSYVKDVEKNYAFSTKDNINKFVDNVFNISDLFSSIINTQQNKHTGAYTSREIHLLLDLLQIKTTNHVKMNDLDDLDTLYLKAILDEANETYKNKEESEELRCLFDIINNDHNKNTGTGTDAYKAIRQRVYTYLQKCINKESNHDLLNEGQADNMYRCYKRFQNFPEDTKPRRNFLEPFNVFQFFSQEPSIFPQGSMQENDQRTIINHMNNKKLKTLLEKRKIEANPTTLEDSSANESYVSLVNSSRDSSHGSLMSYGSLMSDGGVTSDYSNNKSVRFDL